MSSPNKAVTKFLSGVKMGDLSHDTTNLLPVGQYKALVDTLTIKESSKGDQYLTIQFRLNGNASYNNKPIWADFHIYNQNEQARNIATGAIRSLLATAGMVIPEDENIAEAVASLPGCSTEFYVTHAKARTDPETGRTYPPQNRIANYIMPTSALDMLAVA